MPAHVTIAQKIGLFGAAISAAFGYFVIIEKDGVFEKHYALGLSFSALLTAFFGIMVFFPSIFEKKKKNKNNNGPTGENILWSKIPRQAEIGKHGQHLLGGSKSVPLVSHSVTTFSMDNVRKILPPDYGIFVVVLPKVGGSKGNFVFAITDTSFTQMHQAFVSYQPLDGKTVFVIRVTNGTKMDFFINNKLISSENSSSKLDPATTGVRFNVDMDDDALVLVSEIGVFRA